jgi:hypothetical protein
MNNELHIPLHRAIDKEAIRKRIQHVGVKGLDIDKAEELGLMSRISNLLCAMHCLMMASNNIYGEVNALFDLAQIKKHEIKRACQEFQQAYDRWYKFWREYQTVGGVQEMNREAEDLVEQYMRWAGLPVRWEIRSAVVSSPTPGACSSWESRPRASSADSPHLRRSEARANAWAAGPVP